MELDDGDRDGRLTAGPARAGARAPTVTRGGSGARGGQSEGASGS